MQNEVQEDAVHEFQSYTQRGRASLRSSLRMSKGSRSAGQQARWRSYHKAKRMKDVSNIEPHKLGSCDVLCRFCGALHWLEERTISHGSTKEQPIFSDCCAGGKVTLLKLTEPDVYLRHLFESNEEDAKTFRANIRTYNNLLSFCSTGAKFDPSVWGQRGHRIVRLHGSLYHQIGSLLPEDPSKPRFSQIYLMDGDSLGQAQIRTSYGNNLTDNSIMVRLQDMLERCANPYILSYRTAKQRIEEDNSRVFGFRILDPSLHDPRRYNRPTASEVGVVMEGDGSELTRGRDIIIQTHGNKLERVSELHSLFLPLRFPLLRPYGEPGWHAGIPFRLNPVASAGTARRRNFPTTIATTTSTNTNTYPSKPTQSGRGGSMRVTQAQWFSYYLHKRPDEFSLLLHAGELLQEFVVDAWAQTETNRLRFIKNNQTSLRVDLYNGLADAVGDTSASLETLGRRSILPSSYSGSPRQMVQLYQDALTLVRHGGKPDFFLTFTCNPYWEEIQRELSVGQNADDRPDLVSHVFKLKLEALLHDLRKNSILGKVKSVIHVVKFQKRGLPHAHILIIVEADNKPRVAEHIDRLVCAELPDEDLEPELFRTVTSTLLHGPCGIADKSRSCTKDGKCQRNYPRPFQEETCLVDDGYPSYRRRNDGRSFERNGFRFDNRHVVPYSPYLAKKYQAHINLEVCVSIVAVKYLYKYVYKGHDRAAFVPEEHMGDGHPVAPEPTLRDEVTDYIDGHYVGPHEAVWRLFAFSLHDNSPSIIRLQCHLPDQQHVQFNPSTDQLETVITSNKARRTTLTEFFHLCQTHPDETRNLTYDQAPQKFIWDRSNLTWNLRKKSNGGPYGRIYFVPPNAGERYFLRTLLCTVPSPTSFEALRTVEGVRHPTFQAAAAALGLLANDEEYDFCLQEAGQMATGQQLRRLFVTILIDCQPHNPRKLWESHWKTITDDCAFILRKRGLLTTITPEHIKSYGLQLIETGLQAVGKSLADFNIPGPTVTLEFADSEQHKLIANELFFDREQLQDQLRQQIPCLNAEQRLVFEAVTGAYESRVPKIFFLDGPGGTGKTFVENLILAHVRSKGDIALAVASTGIASILLSNGRTAYSRFKIPLNVSADMFCSIPAQSHLAQLLRLTRLIIWDEITVQTRFAVEAVERTMRDIRDSNEWFGGCPILFSGDWRQTLPVVPKGYKSDIIAVCVTKSSFWHAVNHLRLTVNMRVHNRDDSCSQAQRLQATAFADWLISVGDGLLHDPENETVVLPEDLLLPPGRKTIPQLIESVYKDLDVGRTEAQQIQYLCNRAILAARNRDVDDLNSAILHRMTSDMHIFPSADSSVDPSGTGMPSNTLFPSEFLNSINISGFPLHRLSLKIGCPIMLLRNLDPAAGLCNGTRLVVSQLSRRVIEAVIMTGPHAGKRSFIPRIPLSSSDNSRLPFNLQRLQFPVRLAFAMSINKAQGQSIRHLGLYLIEEIFSHGQLYIALSRAENKADVSILLNDTNAGLHGMTRNVVYQDVLQTV